MKRIACWSQIILLIALTVCVIPVTNFAQSQSRNSISGFVYDAINRNPVADVYVELMNDLSITLKRAKTDGGGRFFFGGLSSGTFKVRVAPYGTNYLEEVQDATITNFRIGNSVTSDTVYLDFYLRLDKRKINVNQLNPAAVIFVQEVPSSAKKLYEKAVSQFENKKETEIGFENLKKAIEIFPNYFDALNRLGVEYVNHNKFIESLPYLTKAIEVNPRSFLSFYALGIAFYNLKQWKEASEAFRETVNINSQSALAHLKYGMILRIIGNYKDAETMLLKAKELAKESPIADIHWQLALLYNKIERYKEAADELETFLKIQPDSRDSKQIKDLIIQLRAKTK